MTFTQIYKWNLQLLVNMLHLHDSYLSVEEEKYYYKWAEIYFYLNMTHVIALIKKLVSFIYFSVYLASNVWLKKKLVTTLWP